MEETARWAIMAASMLLLVLQIYWVIGARRQYLSQIEELRSAAEQSEDERKKRADGIEVCSMELSQHEVSRVLVDHVVAREKDKTGQALEYDTASVEIERDKYFNVKQWRVTFYRKRMVMKGKLTLVKG